MKIPACLKHITFMTLALCASMIAAGCSTKTVTAGAKPGAALPAQASVAVVPFENLSNQRHAGLILTDLATTVLHVQSEMQITEVSGLANDDASRLRRLETEPWERQVGMNTASAVEVGQQLHVDYVLAGSVGEYGFVDGFGETANVGLTLRLVSVEDSNVLWAGTISRKASSPAFNDESVHRLAHEVLIELLDQMKQAFASAQ